MQIVEAQTLPLPRLADLFNEGYAGYEIPVQFDLAGFQSHLRHNDIDLALSRVAVVDEPVAFTLIGRRDSEAWVGGMGTVPANRRRGVGERTLRAALDAAARTGARTARLEVLVSNARAIALYEKLGFVITRRLLVYTMTGLPQARGRHASIPVDAALTWIAGRRAAPEPWQRGDASLAHMQNAGARLQAAASDRAGDRVAAVVWAGDERAVSVLQIAAADTVAAGGALLAVSEAAAGRPIRATNFPEDGELARAIGGFGIDAALAQFEMEQRIPRW